MNLHKGVPYKKVDCFASSSTEIIPIDSNLGGKKKEEIEKIYRTWLGLNQQPFG